jgi:hypothetical protein
LSSVTNPKLVNVFLIGRFFMSPARVIVTRGEKVGRARIIPGEKTSACLHPVRVCRVPGGTIVVESHDFSQQSLARLAFQPDDWDLESTGRTIGRVPSMYHYGTRNIPLATVNTSSISVLGRKATIRKGKTAITVEVFLPKEKAA